MFGFLNIIQKRETERIIFFIKIMYNTKNLTIELPANLEKKLGQIQGKNKSRGMLREPNIFLPYRRIPCS